MTRAPLEIALAWRWGYEVHLCTKVASFAEKYLKFCKTQRAHRRSARLWREKCSIRFRCFLEVTACGFPRLRGGGHLLRLVISFAAFTLEVTFVIDLWLANPQELAVRASYRGSPADPWD